MPNFRLNNQPFFLALIGCLVFISAASAHPMGNFSVGHYTRIRVDGPWLSIRYRIDLAEIPTVEEMRRIDTDADGHITDSARRAYLDQQTATLTAAQHWNLNGNTVVPSVVGSDLQERAGAGNLPTLLVTIDYRIPINSNQKQITFDYLDDNYPKRRGWREIVAQPATGASIIDSNVPAEDRSQGLDVYPADLSSPPDRRSAHVVFQLLATGESASATQPAAPVSQSSTPRDRFTALISARSLSASVVLSSLLIAFVLGSFHALSPGHGKTVVAAYLVGSRGTPHHALLLGIVVTLTHVAGVFALGIVVLFASKYVIPERLYPWLGFASGLLIACMGLWQFTRRYAAFFARKASAGHFHDGHYHVHATDGHLHDHEHDHGHHHGPGGHTHDMPDKITPGSLIALGVSGGIVPCPSALVVLLAAIALNRTAFGLVLIIAFSLGLAAVLIAIGILMLHARRLFDRLPTKSTWLLRLPIASSLVIAVLGILIAVQALTAGGILQINL
jgi:ABC-type nickel/cobalt efflux system permease component RcnA